MNVKISFNPNFNNGNITYSQDCGTPVSVEFEDWKHARIVADVLFKEESVNDEEYLYLIRNIQTASRLPVHSINPKPRYKSSPSSKFFPQKF